ncbi:Protein kti12 [Ceratobasidium theobromae]|uniref:Protein kti12 n=1 Tax=Ceratobasidium theobromae TaxID=1582974 RepID=A0A5N5QH08_9AGAM|nr:Protein kti12 [Ceratobasidium theobromae]
MALVTFSGYPASGKTHRAHQLKSYLEQKIQRDDNPNVKAYKVVILSDGSLNIPRNSRLEKPARSALLSAIVRDLSKTTILIVDSLNYIKGFRYQMYCAAREVGVWVATVGCPPPEENETKREKTGTSIQRKCLWRMSSPLSDQASAPHRFENLIERYEEPNSMVRWDSPLFTIPWSDETIPGEDIWRAITSGDKRPANQAVAAIAKPPSDALQVLDQATASIVGAIMSAQSTLGGSGGTVPLAITAPQPLPTIDITLPMRHISLPELSRHKRQFVAARKKAVIQGLAGNKGEMDWDAESVGRKFVEYLEENLAA